MPSARTHAECWTNRGRVDAVVETPCGVYVFEFKLGSGAIVDRALPADGPQDGRAISMKSPSLAQQALAQIKEKGSAEKYLRQGKKVTLVGAAFDADSRDAELTGLVVVREPACGGSENFKLLFGERADAPLGKRRFECDGRSRGPAGHRFGFDYGIMARRNP